MTTLHVVLQALQARLPELEWKLSTLQPHVSVIHLPKGLFRTTSEWDAASYIQEIKADLSCLEKQENLRSAHFLAERIKQKINVLVSICKLAEKKENIPVDNPFGLSAISTRKQWITSLEHNVQTLESQKEAVASTLKQMKALGNTQSVLKIQAELGEVERLLTLAQEMLRKAIA